MVTKNQIEENLAFAKQVAAQATAKAVEREFDENTWKGSTVGKPTIKEVEEYMAALNLPEQSFNGTTAYDIVSKPKHYMLFDPDEAKTFAYLMTGIEVRDVIEKLADKVRMCVDTPDTPLFDSDYVQLMQYLMRFMDKNGKEDLEKARWYLDKMIAAY